MKKIEMSDCKSIIVSKFTEPNKINNIRNILLVKISYEIICIADLIQPNKAYFEIEDQPAINHAMLKPNEHIIAKNILYSISFISSP
jgi:hypothetical protein